jgi:HAD superfamily hydrolase (TIGR01509 family)
VEKFQDIGSMIFDLDGTLIDSVPAYFGLTEAILARIGLPPAPKQAITKVMVEGMAAVEEMIPSEMMHRKNELIETFIVEGRKELRHLFLNEIEPIPGIEELFGAISNRKTPIGLVSSTHRRFMDLKLSPLKRIGLSEYIQVNIAIEDAPQKKPAPDPLIVCARQLGVPTHRCIYVGDNRIDIQAGNAAGMMTIGVLTGLDDRETLEREGPTMIVDSLAEITPFFVKPEDSDKQGVD